MTEEQKKEVATFRFGVIHELVNTRELSHGEQERLIREKCAKKVEHSLLKQDPYRPDHDLEMGKTLQGRKRQD